ncbi:MAG: amidohydrolase [Pikeienuella sp.]
MTDTASPQGKSIAEVAEAAALWRREFHAHPELGYEEHRTAARIAELLRSFGVDEVATGLGGTGVVGVIHGAYGAGGPAIMLRADMDALPIQEETGAPHASTVPGRMHACGHDGHMAMLLGAAWRLSETRAFAGTVYLCFQPAEENGAGAAAMLRDGLFDRFPPRAVYGLHNWPGLPVGQMAVTEGPVFARADGFEITISGRGGHAAEPQGVRDPLLAGALLVAQLQSIVSREIDPRLPAVLSITAFRAGDTHNVIPDKAVLMGTTRCYAEEVAQTLHAAMARICKGVAQAQRVDIAIDRLPEVDPPVVNDPTEARRVHAVMAELVGPGAAHFGHPPSMAGEDFAYLAGAVPGAYAIIGNGPSRGLHHPAYEFDDAALGLGIAYWVRLAGAALPLKADAIST